MTAIISKSDYARPFTRRLPQSAQDIIGWVRDPNHSNRMIVCPTAMMVRRNGLAVMGLGVAKVVADNFDGIAGEYGEILRRFAQTTGEKIGHVTSDPLSLPEQAVAGNVFVSRRHSVVFMPTKLHWKSNSKEDFVMANLRALRQLAIDMKHLMFGVPLPGAENGGLDAEWSLAAMQSVLGDLPNITIVDTALAPNANTPVVSQDIIDLVKNERVLVVSGHRPNKLGGYSPEVRQYTRAVAGRILDKLNPTMLVHGGALGIDQAFADAAEERGLKVIYADPCQQSDKRWGDHDRARAAVRREYARHTGACVLVSDKPYDEHVMHVRDQWMIEVLKYAGPGSGFTCIHNGDKTGGTYHTKKAFAHTFTNRANELYKGNFWKLFAACHPMPASLRPNLN